MTRRARPILRVIARFAVPLIAAGRGRASSCRATTSPAAASSPACCWPRPARCTCSPSALGARRARSLVAAVGRRACWSPCSTGTVPLLRGEAYMDNKILAPRLATTCRRATFFDLGVMLIVLGTLMTIFVELGLERR